MIDKINEFWGLTPEHVHGDEFTGYETLYPEFNKLNKEVYHGDTESTIERVFDLYRSVNLVPITYYTEAGLERAIHEFKRASYGKIQNGRLGLGNNRGSTINRFIFTNMMSAEAGGVTNNSLRDRFYDDTKLRRAIRICFEFRDGDRLVYPNAIRRALDLVTGGNITNFKAQNARAIVEHLCPVLWGRVYDYSCGFGGRLLGVSSSNMNYTYVGVDPNTETYKYLTYLNELIGGNDNEISCETSQTYTPEDIDCAFSSPPYFNLEKYSDEPTQCMVQFSTLDEWVDGYVAPTMRNIFNGLNSGGVFATNIADYKTGKERFPVVDRWIDTASKLGFTHTGTIKMMLNTRPGVGNDKTAGREKFEGIYVFNK
jgi:SAM-dependent methyltransferase